MPEEWVTVVNPSLPGTRPARITKRYFEIEGGAKDKGFEIYDPSGAHKTLMDKGKVKGSTKKPEGDS